MHPTPRSAAVEVQALNLGFQIAPMIDVVFVIMLFFMVMAGSLRHEAHLSLRLPGNISPLAGADQLPTEVTVAVEEPGHVTLNDEEMDSPDSSAMPNFTATMSRLKQEADSRNDKVLVTIQAEEQAKYARVIDVLNALSNANIRNVTFMVGKG